MKKYGIKNLCKSCSNKCFRAENNKVWCSRNISTKKTFKPKKKG